MIKELPADRECRYLTPPVMEAETRADGSKAQVVRGTAVKFNELSRTLGWFREKFAPGAFDNVLSNDVVAVFNHNNDLLLARTISGTLELTQDETGLHYKFTLPDNNAGRDLAESLKRGDVQHSSFAFTVQDEKWEQDDELGEVRTVLKVKNLYDVSPVVFPAYPQSVSELSQRSHDQWKESNTPPAEDNNIILDAEIQLLHLKPF
jgi:uncharacterized protein